MRLAGLVNTCLSGAGLLQTLYGRAEVLRDHFWRWCREMAGEQAAERDRASFIAGHNKGWWTGFLIWLACGATMERARAVREILRGDA